MKKTWGLGGSGGGKAVPQSWRTRESQRWQGGLEGGTNGGVVQVGPWERHAELKSTDISRRREVEGVSCAQCVSLSLRAALSVMGHEWGVHSCRCPQIAGA